MQIQQLNATMYQTRRIQKQQMSSKDIDFEKQKQIMEEEIQTNWIGFKYLQQLEDRKTIIVKKIEEYSSQLKTGYRDLIVYCEFKFNQNLDLLIKTSDIRQQFLDQQPPNESTGVKINQPDLLSALTQIKEFMYNECKTFKEWLLKNLNCKGDIWQQAECFLQNNNEKESETIFNQAEKHRRNMVKQLNMILENQEQYIELSIYLNHYYEYFDRLTIEQRKQNHNEFIQFLQKLDRNLTNRYNQFYKNNSISDNKNHQFIVNQPFHSKNQITVPKCLWNQIYSNDLQGYILCKMIEQQEFNLNYQVIENIFLKNQREHLQNYPTNNQRKQQIF